LTEYDKLLEEARAKAEAFRSTAKEYVRKMYLALRNENPNHTPEDARDRIEKDCVGIWSKRTILDALPDEAKDLNKQKAGRLSQKEANSAAVSAANHNTNGITIPAQQIGVPNNSDIPLTVATVTPRTTVMDTQLRGQTVVEKPLEEGECPDCLLLSIEIDELKEALVNSTQFTKADQISRNEIQFTIPNDKYQQVKAAMDNSANSVYLTFDKGGILERAEPDTFREELHNG
jgi:hypothetical protein